MGLILSANIRVLVVQFTLNICNNILKSIYITNIGLQMLNHNAQRDILMMGLYITRGYKI